MSIKINETWRHKVTGDEVLVLWVSNELVTYQNGGSIGSDRIFIFTQDYEKGE